MTFTRSDGVGKKFIVDVISNKDPAKVQLIFTVPAGLSRKNTDREEIETTQIIKFSTTLTLNGHC